MWFCQELRDTAVKDTAALYPDVYNHLFPARRLPYEPAGRYNAVFALLCLALARVHRRRRDIDAGLHLGVLHFVADGCAADGVDNR